MAVKMIVMRSFLRTLLLAALATCVTLTVAGQTAPPTPLRLVAANSTRTIPTVMNGDTELVAFDDLAALFGVTVREDTVAHAITVSYKGKTIVLSQNQALASISGRLVSLPAPPVKIGPRWYVPVEFIGRALTAISDVPLELRKASRLVLQGGVRAPRVVVRHDAGGNQARIIVDVTPRTPHQVLQEATRAIVRFDADLIDLNIGPFQSQGIVQGIHAGDDARTVAIDLGPRFGSLRAADSPVDPGSTRITIDLFATPDQTAAPPTTGQPPAPAPQEPVFPAPGVKTIVIDPGHGGDETGAKGAKGTLEKAITLSVARRLKSSLEARLGARVLLTRTSDGPVGPDERAALANNNKADLFISLHANASLRKSASGAQVFYLRLDRADEEARQAAESEGVAMPVFGGGTREIDVILWEMAQARHIDQSAALARFVEQQLRAAVPMSAQAVQQAPFRVLVGANMPAILVEMGYLTNATQEAQLLGGEFQARIAQAITEGVSQYFASAPAPLPQVAGVQFPLGASR
jgi:N-acetylmuramoyl-L-alanine amidase